MSNMVTQSAMLQCSFGAAPCSMVVTNDLTVQGINNFSSNIQSKTPFADISGFSMCVSPSNPVISGSAGIITSTPCTPAFSAPWSPGSTTVQITSMGALNGSCMLTCSYASGVITITNPGAMTVTVGV